MEGGAKDSAWVGRSCRLWKQAKGRMIGDLRSDLKHVLLLSRVNYWL
jgi:hypothetical protein